MLERLIAFSLHKRAAILFAVALIILLGVLSALRLPLDAFPDVSNNQVEILAQAPGLSALEIERFVTYPLENALRGLPGISQLRSVTKFGLSVITVVLKDNVDIYFARQQVLGRISDVSEKMPDQVRIELGPIATAMGEIFQYVLEGRVPADPGSQKEYFSKLRTLEDWVVAPMFKSVPGVSDVNSFGGYLKQYHIEVDAIQLLRHNLTLQQVYEAVQQSSLNVSGNILKRHEEQWIVRGIGLLTSQDDLSRIVLKTAEGVPVLLRDVASVRVGAAVRQGAALIDGQSEAVGGIVMMLRGENPREIVDRIEARMQEINASHILPNDIRVRAFYKRSDIVESSIRTVSRALLEGAILVLLILYVFLRSLRAALVVLISLPLSLLLTFGIMKWTGLSANLMSLGGLAVSIGMIIDATIIQVENVQRHLGHMKKSALKLDIILKSVLEVRKPSIFGELVIAVTFVPILSLQGMEGKMFTPLALTVAIALLASLFLSIFVVPVLCALILKPGQAKESPVLTAVKRIYFPLLDWGMRHKGLAVLIPAAVFIFVLVSIPNLGTEFIPVMDEGAFDMDIQFLPGISIDHALETSLLVEQRLKQFPELETIVGRNGQTGIALEARGVDKTAYVGTLKPRHTWTSARDREELTGKMRAALADIPGMAFSFSQPIQCRIDELVAGTRAQLIIKLFGDDLDTLKVKADQISAVLREMRGTSDLVLERITGQPYLTITIDRGRLARHGLSSADVMRTVEMAVGGKTAAALYEENRSFDVVVRLAEAFRNSEETIRRLSIPTPGGYRVELQDVAAVRAVEGPVQISREDGQRRIGIEVNVVDRDIGGFVAEARTKLQRSVQLPTGYYTHWGGQFENQQRAMARLALIGPAVIVLIVAMLYMTFNSMRLALLVVLNLPFALIGGVLALWLGGLYLSVPASVGFIVLFGVAVLNGLVLVSYIVQLCQSGMDMQQAVIRACNDRLRPVLMTAAIAIFSLVPMLFASGPGSEIQRPLATVVVGGLFSSTFLTLLLLPTLYGWFEGKKSN